MLKIAAKLDEKIIYRINKTTNEKSRFIETAFFVCIN